LKRTTSCRGWKKMMSWLAGKRDRGRSREEELILGDEEPEEVEVPAPQGGRPKAAPKNRPLKACGQSPAAKKNAPAKEGLRKKPPLPRSQPKRPSPRPKKGREKKAKPRKKKRRLKTPAGKPAAVGVII